MRFPAFPQTSGSSIKKDGESSTTLDGLKDLLGAQFARVQGPQAEPFVIRETRRKHQHTVSELTVWKRRG